MGVFAPREPGSAAAAGRRAIDALRPLDRLAGLIGRKRPFVPAVPDGHRIYAVGDIHGRLDLLLALLDQVRADNAARDPAEVEIILLGDLIDRGPDSAGVVRRAMAGCDFATLRVLRGNHETAMIEALHGDADMFRMWITQGGDAALVSWGVAPALVADGSFEDILSAADAAIPAEERQWLIDCPLTLRRGDYYFAHAGLRPGVQLERQSSEDTLWIRDAFLASERHHGVMVVHGHSISPEVDARHNRVGIDTGAYASGRLTALGLEGAERWTIST